MGLLIMEAVLLVSGVGILDLVRSNFGTTTAVLVALAAIWAVLTSILYFIAGLADVLRPVLADRQSRSESAPESETWTMGTASENKPKR